MFLFIRKLYSYKQNRCKLNELTNCHYRHIGIINHRHYHHHHLHYRKQLNIEATQLVCY